MILYYDILYHFCQSTDIYDVIKSKVQKKAKSCVGIPLLLLLLYIYRIIVRGRGGVNTIYTFLNTLYISIYFQLQTYIHTDRHTLRFIEIPCKLWIFYFLCLIVCLFVCLHADIQTGRQAYGRTQTLK